MAYHFPITMSKSPRGANTGPVVKGLYSNGPSVGGGGGGGVSPEAQAVLDRMAVLSPNETSSIITFVDGLVSDGVWSSVLEFYAPCLNATDFLTGFVTDTLIAAGATAHTPGEYIDFTTTGGRVTEGRNFDSFASIDHAYGAYVVWYVADTTGNSDMCGVLSGGNETYFRWRGNDTFDFNAICNETAVTPRTAANTRPTGDIAGCGLNGTTHYDLEVGGTTHTVTRVRNVVPVGFPFQWHGRNSDGAPGNTPPSRFSAMYHLSDGTAATALIMRSRTLQFMRDIGVTGIPAT